MFDYIDASDAVQNKLEATDMGSRVGAMLMILHGARAGILTQEEALKQLHNLAVSLFLSPEGLDD